MKEEVRTKEGEWKGQRERERRGQQQHFLRVEPCGLQFSQVSDGLFTLVRDLLGIPTGNPIPQRHAQKERESVRRLPVQNRAADLTAPP